MTRTFILGAGGHARVIATLLDRDVTFVDRGDEERFFAEIDRAGSAEIYLGIGDNAARRRVFDRLRALDVLPGTCIAPNAFVARSARIGVGAVICAGTVIMNNAIIGDNSIINTHSSVDHDCIIGNHTQITVGVSLPGSVRVGENCFFGVKSAVFPGVTIGDNVIVRGGALVMRDVPDNVMVGGNPAKIIRKLDRSG